MLCTINGHTFYLFTKNTWNGYSEASCHIMNDDTSLFDIIGIDREAPGTCQQQRKRSFMSAYNKLMVLSGSKLYGP